MLLKTYQRGKDTNQTKSSSVRTPLKAQSCVGKKLAQKQNSTLKPLFEVLVALHKQLRLHIVVL